MAHPLSEQVQADEKREKRLNSLELRAIEVENTLLRTSRAALEKRVAELEASLKDSKEECNKLKQTIAYMSVKSPEEKDVTPSKNIEINTEGLDNVTNEEISDVISNINKEEEIIYERILKLIENAKSDCQKAINMKIPTESQLPMRPMTRQSSKSISSKSPSPTDGLISPSKMFGRSWTPISIPASRTATPSSGANSPPNTISSHIPTKSPTSPSKTSHLPSRSNTPSGNHHQSNTVNSTQNIPMASSLNKRNRQRTGSCCSNIPSIPSRPHTPTHPAITTGIPSGLPSGIPSGLPSGIPTGLPQKLQPYRRTVTC